MAMRNLRLELCYDGTRYQGWQRLPGVECTIQGKLEQALGRILDEQIEVSGSGRTDAGVHALRQTASFHCESAMPTEEILEALRRYLPGDIGIYSCEEAPPRFHARLNAKQKTYRYCIWNSSEPCVFQRRYVAVFPETLNVEAMNAAGQYLVGEHDFAPFCARSSAKKSTVRRIASLRVSRNGDEIHITITANGFLYHMVRIITGTLIEVGRGERTPESIPALFHAPRSETGFLAPAQGLCLMEVTY